MRRPKARSVRGFRDIFSQDLLLKQRIVDTVRLVYETYGFVPLETPAVEFVDVLGKFLPESSSPEGGIFAFRNPDVSNQTSPDDPDYWVALRYDLTAPLARVVAQYGDSLPRPFRRYQVGPVWRYEKPGPGRFREFMQFDFDTVGVESVSVDAEVAAVMCDVFEALGFSRGSYVVKMNHRQVMQGVLEVCRLENVDINDESSKAAAVLRSIDKLDRLGIDAVRELLGAGRTDATGDFTPGCGLDPHQIHAVETFLKTGGGTRRATCDRLLEVIGDSDVGRRGVQELRTVDEILTALGIMEDRVVFDPTIIRGLGYYTGPVFEGQLTMEITDENGAPSQFGTVYGGGRYDGLVQRFTGTRVPATGASVGVDRLLEAVKLLDKGKRPFATSQVLVTVLDRSRLADYFAVAGRIRAEGLRAEVYLGPGNIGKQIKYADATGIPLALIAGDDEFKSGMWQIKNLERGRQLAASITSRDEWTQDRVAQEAVAAVDLVRRLRELLTSDV